MRLTLVTIAPSPPTPNRSLIFVVRFLVVWFTCSCLCTQQAYEFGFSSVIWSADAVGVLVTRKHAEKRIDILDVRVQCRIWVGSGGLSRVRDTDFTQSVPFRRALCLVHVSKFAFESRIFSE